MNNIMANKKELPYGLWESDVASEALFERTPPPTYPFRNNGTLYWLAAQVREQGRIALMQENPAGEPICITPNGFNIRTAVHEYGGRCFCLVGDSIIFNNYADGQLYRQSLNPLLALSASSDKASPTQQLSRNSRAHNCCGYADLVAIENDEWVLGVMETSHDNAQNRNSLVAILLDVEGGNDRTEAPIILAQGADFYANPVVSSDGKKIAWFEWSHPNMPWDQSRLVCARLRIENRLEGNVIGKTIFLDELEVLIDQPNCAVCQLGFLPDNSLIFASDSETCDYWSMFKYERGEITRLTDGNEEFGEAHWLFGQCRWQAVGAGLILAVATRADGDMLVEVDSKTNNCTVLQSGFSECRHLQVASNELLFIAHHTHREAEIVSLNIASGRSKTVPTRLSSSESQGAVYENHSEPRLIKIPLSERCAGQRAGKTSELSIAYGYFYAPSNVRYYAPKNTFPPLMIIIHGGPTSRATSAYSSIKQYFCSLGFALLDINHRGSTGLGRKYRQSLLGNWGEFDVDDIVDAIKFVGDKAWIDKDLVFIRGSSAGGYTVLRALTRFPQQFAGGACYYGIGNLITLCNITHKFEAQYTARLVGENFDPDISAHPENWSKSRFITRSPVFQIDKLSSPLILFQGTEDRVVPPDLSREVVELLKKKGVKHSYTEYLGEGHGFRQTQTRADALRKERAFFAEIISSRQARKAVLRKKT